VPTRCSKRSRTGRSRSFCSHDGTGGAGGKQVEIARADLADPDARARALKGRELYALINNAGYMDAGLLQDVPIEEARRLLEAMVLALAS
jgi:short-subunit dehydrogenase